MEPESACFIGNFFDFAWCCRIDFGSLDVGWSEVLSIVSLQGKALNDKLFVDLRIFPESMGEGVPGHVKRINNGYERING